MIYKVSVTEDHIQKGCRCDGEACPIFLAMRDAGLPVTHVSSFAWSDEQRTNGVHHHHLPLPQSAEAAIYRFDHMGTFAPFEFEIEYSPKMTEGM